MKFRADYFKLIFFTSFLLVFLKCAPEDAKSELKEKQLPTYQLPAVVNNQLIDISELVAGVQEVILSPEVVNEVGVIFHFVVIDAGDIVLVDEISGKINRINKKGEIIWQIKPGHGDFRYHDAINEFTYDKFNHNIIVYDESKTYVYDLDGQPVEVLGAANFDFHQMVYASEEDVLHSIQGFQNIGLASSPKQLVWVKNQRIEKLFVRGLYRSPSSPLIGGYPEFSFLNGKLHYHAAFRDTFYRIDLPDVYPAFTFSFDAPITTSKVMDMDKVQRKLKYVYQERIPKVYCLAADDKRVALSYQMGDNYSIGLLDRVDEKWLLSHQYLHYKGVNFQAPILYHDGYFLRMTPQYKIDHYRKLAKGEDVTEAWKNELQQLEDEYDDTGGQTIYLLSL